MAVWTFLGTQSMSHVPSSNPFTVATIVKTDGKQNRGFHDLTERQMPKFQTWMLVEWLQKKQKKTYTSSIASWWRFEFTKGRQFCERVDHTSSQFQSYFQGPCNIQSRNGFFSSSKRRRLTSRQIGTRHRETREGRETGINLPQFDYLNLRIFLF